MCAKHQARHPLKGKGTTAGKEREAVTPKDSVSLLSYPDDVMAVNVLLKVQ